MAACSQRRFERLELLAKKFLKKQKKKDFQIWLEWHRINMIHHPTGQVEKRSGGTVKLKRAGIGTKFVILVLLVASVTALPDPQRRLEQAKLERDNVEPRGPRSGGEQRRPGRRHRKLRRP